MATIPIPEDERNEKSPKHKSNEEAFESETEMSMANLQTSTAIKHCRPEVGNSLPDTLELRNTPVRGEGLLARHAISVDDPAILHLYGPGDGEACDHLLLLAMLSLLHISRISKAQLKRNLL